MTNVITVHQVIVPEEHTLGQKSETYLWKTCPVVHTVLEIKHDHTSSIILSWFSLNVNPRLHLSCCFSPVSSISRGCHIQTLPDTSLTLCCENRPVQTFTVNHLLMYTVYSVCISGHDERPEIGIGLFRQIILMDFNTVELTNFFSLFWTKRSQIAINLCGEHAIKGFSYTRYKI